MVSSGSACETTRHDIDTSARHTKLKQKVMGGMDGGLDGRASGEGQRNLRIPIVVKGRNWERVQQANQPCIPLYPCYPNEVYFLHCTTFSRTFSKCRVRLSALKDRRKIRRPGNQCNLASLESFTIKKAVKKVVKKIARDFFSCNTSLQGCNEGVQSRGGFFKIPNE